MKRKFIMIPKVLKKLMQFLNNSMIDSLVSEHEISISLDMPMQQFIIPTSLKESLSTIKILIEQ